MDAEISHMFKRSRAAAPWAYVLVQIHEGSNQYKLHLDAQEYAVQGHIAHLIEAVKDRIQVDLSAKFVYVFATNPFQEEFDIFEPGKLYRLNAGTKWIPSNQEIPNMDGTANSPFFVLAPAISQRASQDFGSATTAAASSPFTGLPRVLPAPAVARQAPELSAVASKRLELDVLLEMDLSAPVNHVPLPCVAGAQDRFTLGDQGRVVLFHRSIMDKLLGKVDELIARGRARQLYVHAPKGCGKSHSMLWLALILWQRRLRGQERLRVVYIPRWYMTSFLLVLAELQLAFSQDDEIRRKLETCTTAASVNIALRDVLHSHQLVVVLDQVYDSPKSTSQILNYDEFFIDVANVVTASSPRFQQQKELLASTSGDVEAFFIPSGLTPDEYSEYLRVRYPQVSLDRVHYNKLYELSGGVPIFINNLLEKVLPNCAEPKIQADDAPTAPKVEEGDAPDAILDAIDAWSRDLAKTMLEAIQAHFDSVTSAFYREALLSFLQQAISRQQTMVAGETLKVADLRFIEMREVSTGHSQHVISPICPAALLAILEFLRLHAMERSNAKG